jgi:hypothetical protein
VNGYTPYRVYGREVVVRVIEAEIIVTVLGTVARLEYGRGLGDTVQ